MRRITTTALAAAALLLPLTACGSANEVSGKADDKPAATTPEETVTPADDTADDAATEDASDEDPSDKTYTLTDTVQYENDVEVSLQKFSRRVSSDVAAPDHTPYARFTVKIVNGSSKPLDVTGLSVNCQVGDEGQEGESIFDEGLDGSPSTRLLAGRTIVVPWGCALPKKETHIQIEVSPDFESEAAIFVGSVK
ncbi:hypothetical protein [Streptomyces fagopyri]|uniref:hypothetical protein n=1 Tax=Streptomyces fagopyri TaxID=2662397 RepID=UPI0037F2126B